MDSVGNARKADLEAQSAEAEAETVLIRGSMGGSVQAFAGLYDRHVARVYRYVYFRVGNQLDAEDLTQQVFLNAWQAIGRYRRTGASFLAWLFTIAHNLVVSHYRKAREVSYLNVEPAVQERWADPEAQSMVQHDQLSVRRAILCLKPEQQQVVIMRFIENLEYADIAAALGKSQGNIRVIQHRALATLRGLLRQEKV